MDPQRRPALIGQAPSRSTVGEPPFSGASGRRLESILGPDFRELLDLRNLLDRWPGYTSGNGGKKPDGRRRHGGDHFPWAEARAAAHLVWGQLSSFQPVLFAGRQVAKAFGVYDWPHLELRWHNGRVCAIIPHPSPVSHWWNQPMNTRKAAEFLRMVAHQLEVVPGREWRLNDRKRGQGARGATGS